MTVINDGLPSSVVSDSSQSGGSSDAWVYVSKYVNSGLYASTTAAVQAAHDALPSTGGTLILPPTTLTLDNVSVNKHLILQGVYGQTRLLPGPSGTIMTVTQVGAGAGGYFSFRDIHVGEFPGDTSVNYAYSTALFVFQNFSTQLDLTGLSAMLHGTGTVFRFSSAGNLTIVRGYFVTGAYALPFLFDDVATPSFFADTINFDTVESWGDYFALFRTGALTGTPQYSNVDFKHKQVGYSNAALIDDALAYTAGFGEIAAGATQIQVSNAGDLYFRTDTPSTANQRIYICTVGGGSPTWVGIV